MHATFTRTGILASSLVLLGLASTATPASGGILKFDFGRKDKPKDMEGFTAVTVHDDYAESRGYGWLGLSGEVKAGYLEARGPAAGCMRETAPDALCADFVAGGSVFGVKVPNGTYGVWMMVGDWGAYEFYPRGAYTVLAEGNEIGKLDHSTFEKFQTEFWRHRDADYRHGENIFDKYVATRFRTYQTEVEVTDGRLELQVRADAGPLSYVGPLNAAIIYPLSEKAAGEAFIAELNQKRKSAFESQHPFVDMQENYVGDNSKEAAARGFTVWPGDPNDLGIASRGGWRDERRPLEAMVSLGEMEPVVVTVRPIRKTPGSFTCSVAPLKGDQGDILPAEAVSIRLVKPWEMETKATPQMVAKMARSGVKIFEGNTVVASLPYFLLDRDSFEGQELVNRQFWLTIRMPATARSTTYTSQVTVSGQGGAGASIPLTVNVVPVQLARPKQAIGLNYSPSWFPDWFADAGDKLFWDVTKRDLQLMYDYGMTTVASDFSLSPKADFQSDDNRWARFIDLYQKTGFEREIYMAGTMNYHNQMPRDLGGPLNPAWQDAFERHFRNHEAVAKRAGQKVVYSIGDETTNSGGEARIIEIARAAKARMNDLNLISDINGYRELIGLAPFLDACGFNNGWRGGFGSNRRGHSLMTRDVIERVKSLGATPWFINGGKGRYPFGIWFWKTTKWGVDGKVEWHFDIASSDPFNPFDGTQANTFGSLVMPGQTCTVEFELCREGIDDLRYLQRLDALIESHADPKDSFQRGVLDRAIAARNYWNDCVPDAYSSIESWDGSGVEAGNAWPSTRLNEMRREVAKLICMFEDKVAPSVHGDVAIADGDTGEYPERQLSGSVTTHVEDPEHATQGTHCFKLTFPGGKGYADKWGNIPEKDWRGYRYLKLDVVNPQDGPATIWLNVRDQLAANLRDSKYNLRVELACKPGKNSFEIPLKDLKASDCDYKLDLGFVFAYHITADDKTDTTVYLDNMRICP